MVHRKIQLKEKMGGFIVGGKTIDQKDTYSKAKMCRKMCTLR